MRSLATINSVSCTRPDCPSPIRSSSYISRTLPLAMRGRSASAVTWRDATSARRWDGGALRSSLDESSGDLIEARDYLVGVAQVVAVIENRVEIQATGALDARKQLAQWHAVVPRALGELLHDPVGLVAGASRGDQREQYTLGEQRAVSQVEVDAHPLDIHGHVRHQRHSRVLHVIEQDGRVGQDHPLDRGVGDVALVPQGHVLEGSNSVAAQDARQAGDLLALDRVALVGHRRGALLAGAKGLLQLSYLGPLEVSNLGCQALQAGAGERDRGQQLGVGGARDDLRGDVLTRQPEPVENACLEVGAGGGVGADCARDRTDARLGEGALQALCVAVRLEGEARELDPEGGRLGVHAVRAPYAERVRVLAWPGWPRARPGRGRRPRRARPSRAAAAPARYRARPRRSARNESSGRPRPLIARGRPRMRPRHGR